MKQFNLSSGVLDLIMKSWLEGTIKQYAPHLRWWFRFCSENGLQPLNADVTRAAGFLTQYFRKSTCEYSSVNTARSALSSILQVVNGFKFGEQPQVTLLHISSKTSLELTSNILATMISLLSGQRSQTLASLSIVCMYLNNSGCVFYISKLLKTSCPKSHQQPIEFKAYSQG